jgi:hypothetical protein
MSLTVIEKFEPVRRAVFELGFEFGYGFGDVEVDVLERTDDAEMGEGYTIRLPAGFDPANAEPHTCADGRVLLPVVVDSILKNTSSDFLRFATV